MGFQVGCNDQFTSVVYLVLTVYNCSAFNSYNLLVQCIQSLQFTSEVHPILTLYWFSVSSPYCLQVCPILTIYEFNVSCPYSLQVQCVQSLKFGNLMHLIFTIYQCSLILDRNIGSYLNNLTDFDSYCASIYIKSVEYNLNIFEKHFMYLIGHIFQSRK